MLINRLSYWLLVAFAMLLISSTMVLAQDSPNVIMIVSDDHAWTDYGFMGHPVIDTPHLDRLADEGAVFANGYVPTSLCRPSLASLITGLYPSQHKISSNDPPEGVDNSAYQRFIEQIPTLPRLLQQSGYRSFQTGKWWEGHYREAGYTHGMTTEGRSGGKGLEIGRKTMQPIYDFIAESGETPFFVWYAPVMPHRPHNPPENYLSRYSEGRDPDLAKYFAMVEWFDATVGGLMDYVREHAPNTLVVYAADNGWEPPTADSPKEGHKSKYSPKSKLSPYDGGLRTPIIVWQPGAVEPGWFWQPVSTIDLAPTILEAAGQEPHGLPGTDLREVIAGRAHPQTVFGELYTHDAVDIERPDRNVTHHWVRHKDWKLIVPVDASLTPELYHLAPDPAETRNLSKERPEKVQELTALLRAWPYRSVPPSGAVGESR